jgi:putative sporulation protein YyaC
MNLRRKIVPKKNRALKIHHDEHLAVEKLASVIAAALPREQSRTIAVVCIGTDRSTGDALGPIVGSKLKEMNPSEFIVYGSLEAPVHAVNLEEELDELNAVHDNPYIIGIDASLGRQHSVGMISFADGPVKPGAGLKKQLPPVGDAHITGIVNVSGYMEYFVLQNTRLNLVMQIADAIAESLYSACQRKRRTLSFRATYK